MQTVAEQHLASENRQHRARVRLLQWADARAQRDAWVREAKEAGLGVSEIARLAGMHRSVIHDILRKPEPASRAQG